MKIRELRNAKGIKQEELSKLLGVSQGNLSNWENGVYEPDIPTLIKIADYFEVSLDCLIGREEYSHKKKPYYAELFESLSPHGQRLAIVNMEGIADIEEEQRNKHIPFNYQNVPKKTPE